MKNFGLILAIIVTALYVYIFGYNNPEITVTFGEKALSLPLFVYTLFPFVTGVLVGILLMLRGFFDAADNYKKLKRQYEKTSIGADDSDLRVKTLENKIKTLEAALKKSLEN